MSTRKAHQERQAQSSMKGAFALLLMAPAAVALIAGAWWTFQEADQGLPLLAGGVVLVVFNVFVLRYLFARLDKETQAERSSEDKPAG